TVAKVVGSRTAELMATLLKPLGLIHRAIMPFRGQGRTSLGAARSPATDLDSPRAAARATRSVPGQLALSGEARPLILGWLLGGLCPLGFRSDGKAPRSSSAVSAAAARRTGVLGPSDTGETMPLRFEVRRTVARIVSAAPDPDHPLSAASNAI